MKFFRKDMAYYNIKSHKNQGFILSLKDAFFEKPQPFKKQPLEVPCKKSVVRNFAKFTEKHLCQSLFFNKVADLKRTTASDGDGFLKVGIC